MEISVTKNLYSLYIPNSQYPYMIKSIKHHYKQTQIIKPDYTYIEGYEHIVLNSNPKPLLGIEEIKTDKPIV